MQFSCAANCGHTLCGNCKWQKHRVRCCKCGMRQLEPMTSPSKFQPLEGGVLDILQRLAKEDSGKAMPD